MTAVLFVCLVLIGSAILGILAWLLSLIKIPTTIKLIIFYSAVIAMAVLVVEATV